MGTGYAVAADIISTMLFFYMPAIYFLTPRKGNRYLTYGIFTALYLMWEIPSRFGVIADQAILLLIGNHCLLLLLIFALYSNKWKRKMFGWAFIMGISLLTELLAGGLLILNNANFWHQYLTWDVADESFVNIGHLMSLLINEVLNTMIALIYLIRTKLKNWRPAWGFLLLPVYQIFIMIGFFMLIRKFDSQVALIGLAMGFFNLLLDGVVLYLLEGVFSRLQKEDEFHDLQTQRRTEFEFYQKESQSAEEIRQVRHDFANQLQAAYAMMDDPENADKVKEILEQMKQNMED